MFLIKQDKFLHFKKYSFKWSKYLSVYTLKFEPNICFSEYATFENIRSPIRLYKDINFLDIYSYLGTPIKSANAIFA